MAETTDQVKNDAAPRPEAGTETNFMVRAHGLRKSYGDVHVLRGLDVDIPEGQVISIIGPSGSGKSTLLRLIMTLETLDEGRIEVDGESLFTMQKNGQEVPASRAHLHRMRMKIGMVFQHFNLFPHMTVLKNVMAAQRLVRGLSKEEAEANAHAQLKLVGLEDKVDEHPARLSGGQKQRVAIARALALKPKVMLFDEITSALDPELVGGIMDLVRDIADQGHMTMLLVTHQMRFARDSSDRVLFFDGGVIVEDGDPKEIFTNPTHERTREFLDSVLNS